MTNKKTRQEEKPKKKKNKNKKFFWLLTNIPNATQISNDAYNEFPHSTCSQDPLTIVKITHLN